MHGINLSDSGFEKILTLALILSERRPLEALSLDGVAPSPKTITDGSYPYFKSMYLVTKPKHSELTRRFVSFVISAQAREILTALGHLGGGTKTSR